MHRTHIFRSIVASLGLLVSAASHASNIELVVDYAYPEMFNSVQAEIAEKFHEKYPAYTVKFRSPTPDYEAAAQQALRYAVTKQMADVSFQGLNRQRLFVDRKLAVDLSQFITKEKNWNQLGYSPSLMSLGQINGQQSGIGFSLSTPVVYYNMDLLDKAGVKSDALPKTWSEIITVADKSRTATPGSNGLHYDWEITGNWLWQAMVASHGGQMMDEAEKRVTFGDAPGQAAIMELGRMVENGTMQNFSYKEAAQLFVTGKLAVISSTTARLSGFEKQVAGKFRIVTGAFPVYGDNAKVPAGGNVAMMFAQDPERQKAAWEFIKFATGPEGATLMTKATGYFPANTLPVGNPQQLGGFYEAHPNQYTAVKQIPLLTGWFAFPGENGLKVTDVINDGLQSVFDKSVEPQVALQEMVLDVGKLLK